MRHTDGFLPQAAVSLCSRFFLKGAANAQKVKQKGNLFENLQGTGVLNLRSVPVNVFFIEYIVSVKQLKTEKGAVNYGIQIRH